MIPEMAPVFEKGLSLQEQDRAPAIVERDGDSKKAIPL
jgi:hypothetical protein